MLNQIIALILGEEFSAFVDINFYRFRSYCMHVSKYKYQSIYAHTRARTHPQAHKHTHSHRHEYKYKTCIF